MRTCFSRRHTTSEDGSAACSGRSHELCVPWRAGAVRQQRDLRLRGPKRGLLWLDLPRCREPRPAQGGCPACKSVHAPPKNHACRFLLKKAVMPSWCRYATLETLRSQFTRPQGSSMDGFADAVAPDASSLVDSTAATTGD